MGLFLGMDPDDMMTMAAEEGLDDPDLEAELAAITGGKAATVAGGKAKHKGRSELCLKMNEMENKISPGTEYRYIIPDLY